MTSPIIFDKARRLAVHAVSGKSIPSDADNVPCPYCGASEEDPCLAVSRGDECPLDSDAFETADLVRYAGASARP